MADWSELPGELLHLIANRLDSIVCHAAFRSVCRSWRSAVKDISNSLPPQPPWIILLDRKTNKNKLSSLNGNKSCELDIPEDSTKRLIGSSGTWLFFRDTDRSLVRVLNPLSKIEICLPSKVKEEEEEKLTCFHKIALSSSSPLVKNARDVVAVAIYDSTKLLFIRPGDEAWTPIATENARDLSDVSFTDIVFYKQQLYAVNQIGAVFVCDINANNKAKKLIDLSEKIPEARIEHWSCRRYFCDNCYLVEAKGDLMLVLRFSLFDDLLDFRMTQDFSVFKLDFASMKWSSVKNLGNHSLFLGENVSTSLVASDASTFARNSIYYCDEPNELASFRVGCNLKDKSFWPIQHGDGWDFLSPSPIWIIPRPTRELRENSFFSSLLNSVRRFLQCVGNV